jgi:hypothetical protein
MERIMRKKYYLLEVEGGIEPIVRGPYQTKRERDNAARKIRRNQQEDDGLFWTEVDETGAFVAGAYAAGFFWEESSEAVGLE